MRNRKTIRKHLGHLWAVPDNAEAPHKKTNVQAIHSSHRATSHHPLCICYKPSATPITSSPVRTKYTQWIPCHHECESPWWTVRRDIGLKTSNFIDSSLNDLTHIFIIRKFSFDHRFDHLFRRSCTFWLSCSLDKRFQVNNSTHTSVLYHNHIFTSLTDFIWLICDYTFIWSQFDHTNGHAGYHGTESLLNLIILS